MKIALIAPSPVPFSSGGAENLWRGWFDALNQAAGIDADLIKLPSPEQDFWSIVDSYRQFAALDLRHFDRVISTKYPAWMAAHPDHHVYLQHKLRGLYDTWPSGLATEVGSTRDHPALERTLQVLAGAGEARSALPDIFAALDELRAAANGLPAEVFALPGALVRRVVHTLDAIGLSRNSIRRHAAISAEVAGRAHYFPANACSAGEVDVIHHPTLPRPAAKPSSLVPEGAIFTASRLEPPKRLDWVIEAYQQAKPQQPLVIAGDGPQRQSLQDLADRGGDIRLVGRLTDAELVAAYASACFVPFVPDREDYGLITLEALQAGRPVLTCSDSGGVTELVTDGENGVITAPSPAALAEGMRGLAEDPALRERLAKSARSSVAHITWPRLVAAFTRPWPRLAVINTFSIFPPRNGGQVRLFNLYRELARHADVTMVNLAEPAAAAATRALAPGLTEIVVPMSAEHARFNRELDTRLEASCTDIAAMLAPELTPAWVNAIAVAAKAADLVILSHPYAAPAAQLAGARVDIYEAHNVEADLKAVILPQRCPELSRVQEVEAGCARAARLVLCCSNEDAARMTSLYQLPQLPTVVANGVSAATYPTLDGGVRDAARARVGLDHSPLALFVGSLHGPNITAALNLVELAQQCPDIVFAIIGSVCDAAPLLEKAASGALPDNLLLPGRVVEAELRVWLAIADVGLNPVTTGSGTNLKMLEYAAAGLPILSTPFGGRGGILQAGKHFSEAEIADFGIALRRLLAAEQASTVAAISAAARQQALRAGDWAAIAGTMWQSLDTLLSAPAVAVVDNG